MKSFSQFLQESYLNEEIPAGMTRAQYNALPAQSRRRLGGSNAALGRQGQPLQGGASAPAIRSARQGMSAPAAATVAGTTAAGAAATLAANRGDNPAKPRLDDRLDSDIKRTTVQSPARKPGDPWNQFPKNRQPQLGIPTSGPSSQVPNRILPPAGGTSTRPALPPSGSTARGGALARRTGSNPGIPDAMLRGAQDAANKPTPTQVPPKQSLPSTASTPPAPSGGGGGGPSGGGGSGGGKPPSGPRLKVPAGAGRALRVAGRIVGPAAAALDVADERSKGSGWLRSLAKGATVAAGGALGGTLGAIGGGGIASGALGLAGAVGGAEAAGKAFDTAAGANAVQRRALATANRRSQAGGALAGIGGRTTFDTKKNTMTTGSGSQRRTVQLGRTSVVTGPGGKQDVGYLAYKDGKAVYKRADTKNLAQTSSNPLERIGRSLFAGAYKQSDAAAAAKKLQQARSSDVARNKALGVKMKPGG